MSDQQEPDEPENGDEAPDEMGGEAVEEYGGPGDSDYPASSSLSEHRATASPSPDTTRVPNFLPPNRKIKTKSVDDDAG